MDSNSRLTVDQMSYEMTHLILMLKGPDAPDFIVKSEEGEEGENESEGDKRNFGNFVTRMEVKILSFSFFIADPTFQYFVLYFGISLLGFLS